MDIGIDKSINSPQRYKSICVLITVSKRREKKKKRRRRKIDNCKGRKIKPILRYRFNPFLSN